MKFWRMGAAGKQRSQRIQGMGLKKSRRKGKQKDDRVAPTSCSSPVTLPTLLLFLPSFCLSPEAGGAWAGRWLGTWSGWGRQAGFGAAQLGSSGSGGQGGGGRGGVGVSSRRDSTGASLHKWGGSRAVHGDLGNSS